jgi:hypothetical protein
MKSLSGSMTQSSSRWCRLSSLPQNFQDALRVVDKLPLLMVVTIVLQIPQTTLNCRLSRIHQRPA